MNCDGYAKQGFTPELIAWLVADPEVWVVKFKEVPHLYYVGGLDPMFPLLVAWDFVTYEVPEDVSFPYGWVVLPD